MFGLWKKSKKKKIKDTRETLAPVEQAEFKVVASLQTDVGCIRDVNEDSSAFVQPGDSELLASKGILFVVADGMGGHSAGEVASRLATEVIPRIYYEEEQEPQAALKKAFRQANHEIYNASLKDETLKGMGTTCTALVVKQGAAISAHVGDSRLYLIRDSNIYLMTEDHSAVMEMVKHGIISLGDARHHPDKNVILRAMGSHAEVEVSTWQEPFPVREGDRFLLCSDGLYDLVEDEEIKEIAMAFDPHSACGNLIALAKERGGHDNITVGIVSLSRVEDQSSKAVPETREVEVLR